jgi:3',5'-cyclic AMP phosphodiesterase CpdA
MDAISKSVLIHEYKVPAPGIRKKVIWHFSDIHLSEYDTLSTEEEVLRAKAASEGWEETRRYFAVKNGEPWEPEQRLPASDHLKTLLELAKTGDALLVAGDMSEYISPANMRCLDEALGDFPVPWLAVCGNHDPADQIPEGYTYSRIRAEVQILELEDMVILGLDDSQRAVNAGQLETLKRLLRGEKPLLILMHVPFSTPENRAILEECGEYFRLDHPQATPEAEVFRELIRENAHKIVAVMAGHLHFGNVSELVPGVTQYVSSQGILGYINRYEIGV